MRMIVCIQPRIIPIHQEVRLLPFFFFRRRLRFLDPLLPCGLQVRPHHLRRASLDAARHLGRNGKQQRIGIEIVLALQPVTEPIDNFTVQSLGIAPPSLTIAGGWLPLVDG
jgi:hypothetical protein